jgi:hypothetical protein
MDTIYGIERLSGNFESVGWGILRLNSSPNRRQRPPHHRGSQKSPLATPGLLIRRKHIPPLRTSVATEGFFSHLRMPLISPPALTNTLGYIVQHIFSRVAAASRFKELSDGRKTVSRSDQRLLNIAIRSMLRVSSAGT